MTKARQARTASKLPSRRSYEQLCTLARTLDVVGERWTLLLIRELMLGPRRFTDLLDGMPGIGRNLLAARLKHLAAAGLLEQVPESSSGRHLYALSADGRALGPALAELGRWGAERLPDPDPDLLFRPAWAIFPMSYMADREAARGVRETYEFRVDGEVFHLRVDDGRVEPRTGPAELADLVITVDGDAFRRIFARDLNAAEAVAQGLVRFEGGPKAIANCLAIVASGGTAAPGS